MNQLAKYFSKATAWVKSNLLQFVFWVLAVLAFVCFAVGIAVAGDRYLFPKEIPVILPKGQPLVLTPGQSAILLQDTRVLARVPAQGDELFTGPVLLCAGTVILSPIVEAQPRR